MDLRTKVSHAANWLDSIARSDNEPIEDVLAAIGRVIQHAEASFATAQARPREVPKVAVATDEGEIRAKIARVQAAMARADEATLGVLREMESTLGAMLPPVSGTLIVGAAPAEAIGKG